MNLEERIQQCKKLWECPEFFLLTPMLDELDLNINYGKAPYFVVEILGLHFGYWMIEADIAPTIIDKMIQAGVPILDRIPFEDSNEENLWGKRKDEFVLVLRELPHKFPRQTKYRILHKLTHNELVKRHSYPNEFDAICEKMIEAGVEIWREEQWSKFKDSNS